MYTHTPLTQRLRSGLTKPSRYSVETHQENKFTHNSLGNAPLQSSQLAEPLWTDSWPKSVELVHASWSPLKYYKKKKKKTPSKKQQQKTHARSHSLNLPPEFSHVKKTPQTNANDEFCQISCCLLASILRICLCESSLHIIYHFCLT